MAITKSLGEFKLPRWNELPTVDQYLEQVLTLLDDWLGDYLAPDGGKVLTRTMINNYVKLKYIPAPENKKYDRLTIACLIVIAIMKPVYTIEEISRLIKRGIDFKNAEFSYDQFCDMIEQAVKLRSNKTEIIIFFIIYHPLIFLFNFKIDASHTADGR